MIRKLTNLLKTIRISQNLLKTIGVPLKDLGYWVAIDGSIDRSYHQTLKEHLKILEKELIICEDRLRSLEEKLKVKYVVEQKHIDKKC